MFGRVLPANPTLADRFSWFVWVVINQMALEVRRRGMDRALETAMQRRILGLWKRLRSVLARWEAGTLTGSRERAAAERNAKAEESSPHPDPPGQSPGAGSPPQGGRENNGGRLAPEGPGKLPRGFGWLGRLLPCVERTAFLPLLNDPEMQAIFERAPQVGRILRPWCHVFGLEMPEWLRLPKRVRVRRSDPPPRPTGSSPVAKPHSPASAGEGADGVDRPMRRRRTPMEFAEELVRRPEKMAERWWRLAKDYVRPKDRG